MFRRRTKPKPPSFLLHSSNRGSDITKPDNTSLIVNPSKIPEETESDELPRALTDVLSEDERENECRQSTSLMNSMSQKQQSTPKQNPLRVLQQNHDGNKSPVIKMGNTQLTNARSSDKTPKKSLQKGNLQSAVASSSTSSNKKKGGSTYFEEVINACGATQLPGNSSYLLSEDQAVFSVKVDKMLKKNDTADKFMKSLEEHIDDIQNLKKMLAHTQTAEDCEVARGPVQEPLMRLLLNVNSIQVDMLNLLIKKMGDIVVDSDEGDCEESQVVTSILRQLRFMNRSKEYRISGKLFEIIDAGSVPIQREIIFMLPEIITEEENEEVCTHLVDLLKFNSLLTHVVIDALTNLPLSRELRSQVRGKILSRLDKCPSEYLPLLVQFIITRCDSEDLLQVITSLREDLPFTMRLFEIREAERQKNPKNYKKLLDENSYHKLTFENLKFSVMASKQMTDIWIKIITNLKTSNDFRCVDLIMLVIIYSNVFGRKSQILSLLRSKIKANVLTETHVQHMFKILLIVAMEYSAAILELASAFLKSFEPVISDFGVVLYEASFIHFNFYLRQNVISEILLHIGIGTFVAVNTALLILSHLAENHLEKLSEHTVSIMGLLIKLPELEPSQVRQLVDIIGTLVFSKHADDSLGLRDELQMFIRKQVSSLKLEQHRKGMVGAVMFVKHSVGNEEGEVEEFNRKIEEANSLLAMGYGSSTSCETRKGFFNDELATLIRENDNLHVSFIESWHEKAYKLISTHLFVKNIDLECEHFPMSLQYSLQVEEKQRLVFPILDFVLKDNTKKDLDIPLTVIPSLLRLFWCSAGDFDRLEPFISASVIMPDSSVFEKFGTFDDFQQKIIMDCLYLCANYFIECINAFCTQKTGEKLLIRIKQLVEVRKLISTHQSQVTEYTPPLCQFYALVQKPVIKKRTEAKKPKKGKKRKSDGSLVENSTGNQSVLDASELPCTSASASTSVSVEVVGHAGVGVEESDLQTHRGYFRELQCHTFKLLRTDLSLNPTKVFKKVKLSDILVDEVTWSYRPAEKPELGPSDLLFLLEDFIFKSEQILKDNKRTFNAKSKPVFSSVDHITPDILISGVIKILPKLCTKLEICSSYCKDLLAANDGVYDALGMFPKDSADIKLAFSAALRVISDLLSWRGFQSPKNKTHLKDVLTTLSRSGSETQTAAPMSSSAKKAADYLASFSDDVLILSGGLSLVKGVESCLRHSGSGIQSEVLSNLCRDFLRRPWFTASGVPEIGAAFNQLVDVLLKTYFASVENRLEVVKKTAAIALDEVDGLTTKHSFMATFKTINKANFPLLYRALCESLVTASTTELSNVQDDHENCLEIWSSIVQTLLTLVEIVKIHSSRINLSSLLKKSQSIIQLFLSKGMPVMESALRVKSGEVLKLLKSLQVVTRFLHYICCHSKITSDSALAAHVPTIRSQCDRITLEVKGMLILNKIPLGCITIAVLKNKDLKGNDILSQETNNDSDDESELLLPEETVAEDDEERETETSGDPQESNSEVY